MIYDSSSQVYCGLVYTRVETTLGIRVKFLCAKTKVAFLKKLSIPRLEMCFVEQDFEGCISGFKGTCFYRFCILLVGFRICTVVGEGKKKCWKPYEENRVVSIRKIINKDNWYHKSGVNNAANVPTRACEINDFKRWFDGPQFLYTDIDVISNLCSDFFHVAGHIALDVDTDFKVGSDVLFDVAAEHINNLSIVLML